MFFKPLRTTENILYHALAGCLGFFERVLNVSQKLSELLDSPPKRH